MSCSLPRSELILRSLLVLVLSVVLGELEALLACNPRWPDYLPGIRVLALEGSGDRLGKLIFSTARFLVLKARNRAKLSSVSPWNHLKSYPKPPKSRATVKYPPGSEAGDPHLHKSNMASRLRRLQELSRHGVNPTSPWQS